MSEHVKRKTINLNKEQIKQEFIERQVFELQKSLLMERRKRITVMAILLSALLFTFVYGTMENPFQYTLSKIGNIFTIQNRIIFIIWSVYTGLAIYFSILALHRLENYKNKMQTAFIGISAGFLIITALAPSLPDLPFWTKVHLLTGALFALFLTLGFYPFIIWVARENPRLRQVIYVWLGIAWGGGSFFYITLGNTGMFEMWFFGAFLIFLLYLSMTLFEEKIIKQSVELLRDEENLNIGIEKIFINLEEENKKARKPSPKKIRKQTQN